MKPLVVVVLALLSACATVENEHVVDYEADTGDKFPPVALYYTEPGQTLVDECTAFDRESVMQSCVTNHVKPELYRQQLTSSGQFEQVLPAEEGTEYQIRVSTARFGGQGDVGKSMVAGATLMMVPVTVENTVKAQVTVAWNGIPIKTFSYAIPEKHTLSLFHDRDNGMNNFAASLVSYFLRDARREQVFSGHFLSRALSASDYETNLRAPERILDFRLAGRRVFPNPFLGAQLRYQHVVVPTEVVDIFVYPVKRSQWTDLDTALKGEESRSRKELDILKQQGTLTRVELDEGRTLQWRDRGRIYTGRYFSGTLENKNHEVYHSSTYFFIKKDKILEFRVSRSVLDGLPRVDNFVRQAVAAVEPPDESAFMAKLRQEQR